MPRLYRMLMWLIAAIAGLALIVALGGLRGVVGAQAGAIGAVSFGASMGLAAIIGLLGAREGRSQRSQSEAGTLHMMLLIQLTPRDDATLEQISRSRGGGPAANTARDILAGRKACGTGAQPEASRDR